MNQIKEIEKTWVCSSGHSNVNDEDANFCDMCGEENPSKYIITSEPLIEAKPEVKPDVKLTYKQQLVGIGFLLGIVPAGILLFYVLSAIGDALAPISVGTWIIIWLLVKIHDRLPKPDVKQEK